MNRTLNLKATSSEGSIGNWISNAWNSIQNFVVTHGAQIQQAILDLVNLAIYTTYVSAQSKQTVSGAQPGDTGGQSLGNPNNDNSLKKKIEDVVNQIKNNNGRAPQGYKGDRQWMNDGRENSDILPRVDKHNNPITYREYDINPHTPGVNRGGERLLWGSDDSLWYTIDHYEHILPFKP